jgi:hypothetical protein
VDGPTTEGAVKGSLDEVIAIYLPQFHPTVENDAFWGPGFTEWTNVAAARPLYRGHRQPFLPADLGFYDLRVPEVRAAQAALARAAGVTAFCYWHYWFAGRRVLDLVITEVLESGAPDFPFCLGWGNQSWTGVWHGAPHRVLIEQTYPGIDDHRRHFETLWPLFADRRYLRIDGRPVFYVQEPAAIPHVEEWVGLWQELARDAGFDGLFLVGEYRGGPWDPQHHGFDGSVAIRIPHATRRGPSVVRYADVLREFTSLDDDEHFPCVVPRWDNTPRSGRRGVVVAGSTPELFREHVGFAVDKACGAAPGRRIVWVKSWNEWAEGNTLEPDRGHGHAYLHALREGLASPRPRPRGIREWGHGTDGRHPLLARIARAIAQFDPGLEASDGVAPVPVVLCIDCEPDPRMVNPSDPPPLAGYQLVHEFFAQWRPRVEDLTGAPVHLNWFYRMDPQIAIAYGSPAAFIERHPELLARVRDAGDGLGVHPHAWRWDTREETWVADFADSRFVRECLELAVATFRDSVGEMPTLLRYGDSFLDQNLVATADALGIAYDLTLEPGQPARPVWETTLGELATAWQPDWRRVPRYPYHPAVDDYRLVAANGRERGIRFVPLSSGPRWLGKSILARWRARRAHGSDGWKQRNLLYMALPHWTGVDGFGEMLRRTLKVQKRPYLAFAIRTDWARRVDHRRNIERCLDALLREHRHRPLVFCTPAEAWARLHGEASVLVGADVAPTVASRRDPIVTS